RSSTTPCASWRASSSSARASASARRRGELQPRIRARLRRLADVYGENPAAGRLRILAALLLVHPLGLDVQERLALEPVKALAAGPGAAVEGLLLGRAVDEPAHGPAVGGEALARAAHLVVVLGARVPARRDADVHGLEVHAPARARDHEVVAAALEVRAGVADLQIEHDLGDEIRRPGE